MNCSKHVFFYFVIVFIFSLNMYIYMHTWKFKIRSKMWQSKYNRYCIIFNLFWKV